MPKDAAVDCPAGQWTELTAAAGAAGDVTVGLVVSVPVWLKASASSTAPSGTDGTVTLIKAGDGWSQATIAEMFPGVSAATHLHARPVGGTASRVGISHA